MLFLESLSSFWVGLKRVNTLARELANARIQRRTEDFIESELFNYYTFSETILESAARQISSTPLPIASDLRELMKRIKFEASSELLRAANKGQGDITESLLFHVKNSDRKTEIHIKALRAAKGFWQTKLQQPDNPLGIELIGRRRLTQISAKLETFTNSHDQPDRTEL